MSEQLVTLWRPTGPRELELVPCLRVPALAVTRFDVRRGYLDRNDVQQVGGQTILEYWIPAEELEDFNDNVVGTIDVMHTFR